MNFEKTRGSFYRVLKRELDRMTSRKLYFGVCIVLPLFCIFFMSSIFGSGQMVNIPIGVVDLDQSSLSREILRSAGDVQTFKVVNHYTDLPTARKAMVDKEIYAYLVIPSNFQSKLLGKEHVTITYYYHFALLSVGEKINVAFQQFFGTISAAPLVEAGISTGQTQYEMQSFLLPVTTQSYPLANPTLDYSIYLSNPFFFVLLQVLLLVLTVYVLGLEIKQQTADDWMQTADGNIFIAVVAKLLPYTIIFVLMGIFANYVMFGFLEFPHSGTFLTLNLTTALFIIATQAFGTFIFSLFPAVSLTMSIISMTGSLGATLSGVTFPTPFMYPAIYYISFLFPIRHFVLINQNILYGNYGFAYVWQNVASLFVYLLLALLILPYLKRAILSHKYEHIE